MQMTHPINCVNSLSGPHLQTHIRIVFDAFVDLCTHVPRTLAARTAHISTTVTRSRGVQTLRMRAAETAVHNLLFASPISRLRERPLTDAALSGVADDDAVSVLGLRQKD